MAVGGVVGAAARRASADFSRGGGPQRASFPRDRSRSPATARPNVCPELDCVRHLLPHRIVTAAEHRARSIGVGAERVLICAGAMTEEAYLTALASSLGTSYERFDGVSRADCPLSDDALIEAAAAGLLPLRQGRDVVWIIAPSGSMARRLADPRKSWPVRSFRLTSSDRLRRFVMRHAQRALGGRAADGLRRSQPHLSNAPFRRGGRTVATAALVLLAFLFSAAAPIAMIETLSGLMCTLFLAAAILRLWSAYFARAIPKQPIPIDDAQLPIYTVICALYRETAVVNDLVAAIRALDYPGIMAQAPQAN